MLLPELMNFENTPPIFFAVLILLLPPAFEPPRPPVDAPPKAETKFPIIFCSFWAGRTEESQFEVSEELSVPQFGTIECFTSENDLDVPISIFLN